MLRALSLCRIPGFHAVTTFDFLLPWRRRRSYSVHHLHYNLRHRCRKSKSVSSLSAKFSSSSAAQAHVFAADNNEEVSGHRVSGTKPRARVLEDFWKLITAVKPAVQVRTVCPNCDGGSTRETSFSMIVDRGSNVVVWCCFRATCGWKGGSKLGDLEIFPPNIKKGSVFTEESLGLEPLCEEIVEYFQKRHISEKTLNRNRVCQKVLDDEPVIAFPYTSEGRIVNCKYRDAVKNFKKEANGEDIFYGVDDIKGTKEIIIVEGEIDKLSFEEAGYKNCVSVPYPSNGLQYDEECQDYEYLEKSKKYLDQAERIILALDADEDGELLANQLAQRIGYDRCFKVLWPKKTSKALYNDANEVLRILGPEYLQKLVSTAIPFPVRGLVKFEDYFGEIDSYYNCEIDDLGVSTGWSQVDEFYKVIPGEVTIVSGVPNSGKSEWIDALMCNLNASKEWTFALCSMENKIRDHGRKLLEKFIRKPFFDEAYGGSQRRMSTKDLERGKAWLATSFYLIRPQGDSLPSITWILERAKAAVLRHGVRGLVIDPYNELDHEYPSHGTETNYVSILLTHLKLFAHGFNCHVWFVAHPRQMPGWNGEPPQLYDIAGSAHFVNKCDNLIIIHRSHDGESHQNNVQVNVVKVRSKVTGKVGQTILSYNRATGEYS